ncbi:MAG: tetrathionate reductase family octaheme c-type cytochrome, partial [Rhodospirillales bacterium]|nr:tetrathionate reductase family octaheme c-type cytochrome [Rhodospirillales bacterium]
MRVQLALAFVLGLIFGGVNGAVGIAAETAKTEPTGPIGLSTADHSRFEELKQDFASGPEVTKACLGCHNQASMQVHTTIHWNWQFSNGKTGQLLGKKNLVNGSFISTASNEPFCTRCHIGYDWTDETFDFAAEEQVDCLVCHDTTGTYDLKRMHLRKAKCTACHVTYDRKMVREAVKKPDFSELALKVGKTNRESCGSCHFLSDGGDGVKHGDLDTSLTDTTRDVDVHMAKDGLNFSCATCHKTDQHQVPGSRYSPISKDVRGMDVVGGSRATCESCHGLKPHPDGENAKLNDHVDRVACQTCHIPAFARGGLPTQTYWDWSTAGKLDDAGKEIVKRDDKERIVYSTKRGDSQWAENVVPDYVWFNGDVEHRTLNDKIDPAGTVSLNTLGGTADDARSRIWPVKTLRGKQPVDAGNSTLAAVHLFGKDKDAYWNTFDWEKSIAAGMKAAGHEFSGKVGFAETEMRIPINHMVAPKGNALDCEDCHAAGARLENVSGFYLLARDHNELLEKGGWVLVLLTLAGVIGHGTMRLAIRLRRGAAHAEVKLTSIYIFKRFERFWHWTQAALIMFMALTGFEIHGLYAVFGFQEAVHLHTTAAWLLIGLWAFAIFWHFSTGEWRHYIPSTDNLIPMVRF